MNNTFLEKNQSQLKNKSNLNFEYSSRSKDYISNSNFLANNNLKAYSLNSQMKKNYMIKVIRDVFIKGIDNGIARIRHTYESVPKSLHNENYEQKKKENESNDKDQENEKNEKESKPTTLKTSLEKLNISTKDLKAKSEELIRLIKINFDKYNLDDIFQTLLIMHHFKIKDFELLVKIEKRIMHSFMDMKQDNQAKIIYYFGSLDYFSNKFYFLAERFLIKNIEAVNDKNFLLILMSIAKNPFLTPGLITLLETHIERRFNDFKLNQLVEIFLSFSKIYDRFSYFFEDTKNYELFQKIWGQINTHFLKVPANKLIDLYLMVFSIDSKKLKNKKHIQSLKILDDLENAKKQVFQILNTFYIDFYHKDSLESKKEQKHGSRFKSLTDSDDKSGIEELLQSDQSVVDLLVQKDQDEKEKNESEEQKAQKGKIIYKIILTHHFGEDALFNFSDLYDAKKTSSANADKNKENYSKQVDLKIKSIFETNLPKLDKADISTIFKTIDESHLMKIFDNPKEIDLNTEVLKFNFFVYNEIIKNIDLFLPEEINAIFSIILKEKISKKKLLFLNYENNFAYLLDKFIEVTKKDYLFMSVEEQCLYLQTIYEIIKNKSQSEEFKKLKEKAKDVFEKIEKEMQDKRIKRLHITQVVPILDVYKYIGRNQFKLLDPNMIMDQILFLLANETSDNFDNLFDDYYHITLLMHDLMDEPLIENKIMPMKDLDFWKEFSKYSKLFMNSKKIDQMRLKKLVKLLDNKLNR